MKWIILAVFLNGATGTVHDAMIDMNVDQFATYEACRAAARDTQKRFAAETAAPPMKVYCWRVDMENSGELDAGGVAKNNADSLLRKR